MATYPPVRRPLTNRSVQGPSNPSPSKQTRTVSGSKRPLSPDHGDFHASSTVKRARSANTQETPTPQDSRGPEKGKKASERIEREQKAIEFKDKYSRAFPTFKFYFDYENVGPKDAVQLKSMILRLGGVRVFEILLWKNSVLILSTGDGSILLVICYPPYHELRRSEP